MEYLQVSPYSKGGYLERVFLTMVD